MRQRGGKTCLALVVSTIFCIACSKSDKNPTPNPPTPQPPSLTERIHHHQFPKLANQLQGYIPDTQILQAAADWDLLIVDCELTKGSYASYLGPTGSLRQRNQYLVVLTYFSAADVIPGNTALLNAGFIAGLQDGWYMKDMNHRRVKLFELSPNHWTEMLNLYTTVSSYIPSYLQINVLVGGLTDGIFYDWINESISWLNSRNPNPNAPLDIDNDGAADNDTKLNKLWIKGTQSLLKNSRATFTAGTLLLGNSGWITGGSYDGLLNGMMIEQFLEGESLDANQFGWSAVMRSYLGHCRGGLSPNLTFIMANRDSPNKFTFMRFALASALMGDGYFCYTNRNGVYGKIWWFDEYAVNLKDGKAQYSLDAKGYLGAASGESYNVLNANEKLIDALKVGGSAAESKVWRRDFAAGIALVNPTTQTVAVSLNGNYKKILGSGDPVFNDGSTLNSITLPARSGAVLLRSN